MLLSALVDAGAEPGPIAARLGAALGREIPLFFEGVRENALSGMRLKSDPLYGQPLAETLSEIEALIARAQFSESAKEKILGLYRRIYEVEASIHGVAVEHAHLHELAALDTFLDLAGAVLAMEDLGIASWSCGPIPTGSGTVTCRHGVLPVPAPATARLLEGMIVFTGPETAESTTPTGAVLASFFAKSISQAPPMVLEKIGIGFGQRKGVHAPNVLRVLMGGKPESETVYEVKATMDDITGQLAAHLMTKLFESGALDVTIQTVVMKKNRPGIVMEALCPAEKLDALAAAFFRESPTIGLRYQSVGRITLDRRIVEVATSLGKVPVKCSYYLGKRVQATPEFDVVKKLAEAAGVPLKEVLAIINSEVQRQGKSVNGK